jgi:hypothetical protein
MTRWFTKPWSFQKDNGVTLLTEGSMSYQQLSPLFTTVAGWTSVLVQLNRHRWKSKREGDHDCGEVSHGPSSQNLPPDQSPCSAPEPHVRNPDAPGAILASFGGVSGTYPRHAITIQIGN